MNIELFRRQAREQLRVLNHGMLALERGPAAADQLETCQHAARLLKTAAWTVGLRVGAHLAEAMEQCFAAARYGRQALHQEQIGLILHSVDVLERFTSLSAPVELACVGAPQPGGEMVCEGILSSAWPSDERMAPVAAAGMGPSYSRHFAEQAERGASMRKRVLVVDGSREIRELECKLLGYRGYEVEVALDGIDAWYALRAGDFHLVLTGVDMPLLDGFELTRRIRMDPRLHVMSVVIVCDHGSDAERWRAFDAGADYYVLKDRLHGTLVQVVARLIGVARR